MRKISFQLSHATSLLSVRGSLFLLLIFVVIAQYISSEVILIMFRRVSTIIIPHDESYLRVGDVLTVFGTNTAMEDM